jgi:hypothetical protein
VMTEPPWLPVAPRTVIIFLEDILMVCLNAKLSYWIAAIDMYCRWYEV